ncbi:MAG: hypothetical protein LBM01_03340 [Christensenellaceae bacterium]|jgi:hypothetical protein|nr:hypothetical protein [Christensenellaceae bacterium]
MGLLDFMVGNSYNYNYERKRQRRRIGRRKKIKLALKDPNVDAKIKKRFKIDRALKNIFSAFAFLLLLLGVLSLFGPMLFFLIHTVLFIVTLGALHLSGKVDFGDTSFVTDFMAYSPYFLIAGGVCLVLAIVFAVRLSKSRRALLDASEKDETVDEYGRENNTETPKAEAPTTDASNADAASMAETMKALGDAPTAPTK